MKKSTERACFIINPKAAAGLAGRNISKLESAVATVDEGGIVTAVGQGVATISVETQQGGPFSRT